DLAQVPWTKLKHAYGSATDTPQHLLALLSSVPAEREKALDALWASICHQGSIYEASCAAIPFLIRILDLVPEEQRPPLLILLADSAHRDWYANRDSQVLHVDHYFDSEHRRMVNVHKVWSIADFLKSGNEFHGNSSGELWVEGLAGEDRFERG